MTMLVMMSTATLAIVMMMFMLFIVVVMSAATFIIVMMMFVLFIVVVVSTATLAIVMVMFVLFIVVVVSAATLTIVMMMMFVFLCHLCCCLCKHFKFKISNIFHSIKYLLAINIIPRSCYNMGILIK